MRTPWIEPARLARALARNEAFWTGGVEDGPLVWITAPNALPGAPPPEPATEEALWTDVGYVLDSAEHQLAHTQFAGDALPVHNPWLGPDQVAAWLGAELTLAPRLNTSWVAPLVRDWDEHPRLAIDPANRWWKLYLAILRGSVERGRDKWVTAYPDLHTGIDGLRGPARPGAAAGGPGGAAGGGPAGHGRDDRAAEVDRGPDERGDPARRSGHQQLDHGLEPPSVSCASGRTTPPA